MKRSKVEKFLEENGILHAERVEFTPKSYTVWSYRRDENGQYILNRAHENMPIVDIQTHKYEDD